jgi:hypothetical protein
VKSGEDWKAYSYVWNEDDSDAFYNPVGDILTASFVDKKGVAKSVDYAVPNKNQCKSCHNRDNIIRPLGPIVQNLDKDFSYPDGKMNQISKWQSVGYLAKDYVKKPNHKPLADWQDKSKSLEERSLAYLQVNCGHCHRENGSAHTTGLFLLTTMNDRKKLGICKTPVAAGKGAGNLKFGIQPGQPDALSTPRSGGAHGLRQRQVRTSIRADGKRPQETRALIGRGKPRRDGSGMAEGETRATVPSTLVRRSYNDAFCLGDWRKIMSFF